ncbi:MAG: pilus assembly protein PilM [Pseudomonadota bacterium]
MLFQTSLGVDIQDNSVSLVYLRASFRGVRLAAHATYPFEEGTPGKDKADLVRGLIRDFVGKNSISPASIFLGVPRDVAIFRYVELPLAVKENLRDSLGYEMEKYVPFSANEIYFDCQVIAEDKDSGKMKLLIIAAKKEAVDPYLDLSARIGVGISGIEIGSTAMANYFSYQRDPGWADTCAIVYLSDGRLELDLLKGGFLDYSRSVHRGEWGPDLLGFISHELQKLKDGLGERRDSLSAVFCGFDAAAEMVDHFRADEGLEIRFVDLSRRGIPSFAMIPAYGLALKGILKLPTDINLVPEAFRKRPNKAGHYTMFVLAGLLILLALAWGGGIIVSQQLHLRRLNTEIARLGAEVANIEQTRKKCNEIEMQIDYLNALYRVPPPLLEVFKELSLRIPKKNAWVRRLTISDGEVKMDGEAEVSSELISSLEGSPLFRDVAFLSSITRRGQSKKEFFRIGLKLN